MPLKMTSVGPSSAPFTVVIGMHNELLLLLFFATAGCIGTFPDIFWPGDAVKFPIDNMVETKIDRWFDHFRIIFCKDVDDMIN